MNDTKITNESVSDKVRVSEPFCSTDDFEDEKVIKRANVVIDEEKMKISTPKDEGLEWDY